MLFLLIAEVSANDINTTDEISTTDDVDEIVSSTINQEVIAEDSNDLDNSDDKLEYSSEDNLSEEGEFIDVSEAYAYMNAFRTEDGVWYWNSDDTTKSVFNTNDTNQLKPLIIDSALEETAKTRAKEMALNGTLSHTRPDGSDCWTAYPSYASGENIAYTYSTSCEYVTDLWKETTYQYSGQGHRRNMLSTRSNAIGIAGYKLNGKIWWVQSFGNNRNLDELTLIKPADAFTITNNTSPCEFKIELSDDASGTFIVKVDDNVIDSKILSNGKANITATGLSEGSHEVLISYSGDDKYYSINQVTNVNITQNQNPTNPPSNDIGTFTELNNLIQNATENTVIKLDKDYLYENNIDSEFVDGINITKSLTIDGQGHVIDANNFTRIFNVISSNVVIKNMKMIKGYDGYKEVKGFSYYYSTAIKWSGINGKIDNCTFNYNLNDEGAILWIGANGEVINSTFINNNRAIIWNGANGVVINSTFINNSHTAIYWSGTNGTIIYSTFTNNNGTYGRSIGVGITLNIINSTFIQSNEKLDNEIFTQYPIKITGCIFKNNTSEIPIESLTNSGTLTDLINLIHSAGNNLIKLDKDYVYDSETDSDIGDVIIINKPFTIEGQGHIISCAKYGDLLSVTVNNTINIANLTFYGIERVNNEANNSIFNFCILHGCGERTPFINTGNNCTFNSCVFNKGFDQHANFANEGNDCTFNYCTFNCPGGAAFSGNNCTYNYCNFEGFLPGLFSHNLWCGGDNCSFNFCIFDKATNHYNPVLCIYGHNCIINSCLFIGDLDDSVNKLQPVILSEYNCLAINCTFNVNQSVAGVNTSFINCTFKDSSTGTDDTSNKINSQSSNSNTNTISKVKTTITAKKKIFKAKTKTKKYTITLKAGKKSVTKVKVYLKIGKKTFKATTNKNGKATFKIKLNKKGTYKSKITFKGSKIYKATTKKVTIKIK